jgi:LacI family transcriptional regulator
MMEGPVGKPKVEANSEPCGKPICLKTLAAYLDLNPATVSVVLNDVPGRSIPEATRARIKAAALKFGYQPNLLARSLRNHKTRTIGVLVPELSGGYHTELMRGIGEYLMQEGYFYFTVHHRHRPELIEQYSRMLLSRGAEALIAIDTLLEHSFPVPVVAVAGYQSLEGVCNVVLDHHLAAELTLKHLYGLGHRQLAFMRGQAFSSDSKDRWENLVQVARELGLQMRPECVVELSRDITTPDLGYPVIQQLLASKAQFTALVSFNDIAAFGAMRALHDAGLSVPRDVSVIGFDDVAASSYSTPRLTTIRQPLSVIGTTASQYILGQLRKTEKHRSRIVVRPELVIRESTATVRPVSSLLADLSIPARWTTEG